MPGMPVYRLRASRVTKKFFNMAATQPTVYIAHMLKIMKGNIVTTPQAVIAVADTFAKAGYKEGKNNDTVFGDWYKLPNNPWCAMFVSYCFNKAGAGKLVGPGAKGFASCTTGLNWFKKNGAIVPVLEAKAGDIVFFNWDGGSVDHVGIVVSNNVKKKLLTTIEGNTSSGNGGSQSNGEGVYRRVRGYNVVTAVARPKWPATVPAGPNVVIPVVKPVNNVPAPVVAKPVKPAQPVKVFIKILPGDSYWKIAATILRKKRILAPLQVKREAARIQALNHNKKLIAGDKIRIF